MPSMLPRRLEMFHNVAHVLLGVLNLNGHDRLEQLRIGLLESVLDSHGTGDLEGGLEESTSS